MFSSQEIREEIREASKKLASSGSIGGNKNELLRLKTGAKAVCQELNAKALSEKRDFTAAEQIEYGETLALLNHTSSSLERWDVLASGHRSVPSGIPGIPSAASSGSIPKFPLPDLANYIRDKSNGIRAALSDGGDLVHVLPGHIVDQFLAAYPGNDPYTQAGASITNLDTGWVDGVQPVIAAGTPPSVYAEGDGPDTDESAAVYALELKTPKKIAFLTLPTEEAVADVDQLASTIGAEGIRRLLNGRAKRVTDGLVSQLASAGATLAGTGDNYQDILDLIGKIPPAFSSNNLVFMGSRKSRSRLLNTRATGTDIPLFSPDMSKLLGVSWIVNDFVPDQKILFGDFASAVFIRSAQITSQRLDEQYKERGAVGFRFVQRSDWGFFSTMATASQVEQPLYMLTGEDFGS